MDHLRLAPLLGTLACLSVVGVLLAPYLALPATEAQGLGTYYASGLLGSLFVGVVSLFVLVAAIALVGAYRGQSAPELVAGMALVLGLATALLVAQWAVAVPDGVVQSVGTADWLDEHRWALLVASLAVPASAGWYAAALFGAVGR